MHDSILNSKLQLFPDVIIDKPCFVICNTCTIKDTCGINPMRTIPAAGNSCLGSVLTTIYEFGSIQFLDTLMSDGYLHVFLTK